MKHATLPLALVALALCGAAPAPAPVASPSDRIIFEVRVKNDRGIVWCAMFDSSEAWLEKPIRSASAKPKDGRAQCVFDSVRSGSYYAISAYHDENENKELDTNFLGIPEEGYCASRKASEGAFGPPAYSDARFLYQGGESHFRERMRYLL